LGKSLLDYLQEKGLVDEHNANQIRVERTKSSKTEEELIKEKNLVDEVEITKAKSDLFKIPYTDLGSLNITESILREVDINLLKRYKAVPFKHEGDIVSVAMQNPFDVQAIQALEQKYPQGTRLSVFITTPTEINATLERQVGDVMSSEVSQALEDVDSPVQEIDASSTQELSAKDLQNAPVARIVNSIMQYAVSSLASDVHIEPLESRLRVRFRIHGVMAEKLTLPKNLANAISSRIKIMSNLKIDERRVPQDGRFPLKVSGKRIDVRVSTLPMIYGEKVVMRLLESDLGGIAIEKTGLRGHAYKAFLDAIKATNGIILVTGPTGSGKTRTLASSLLKLNDPKVNIVSLEDPVEIRIPGVSQVQVNNDVGLTFAGGLRSILRQDPDIVMVGEIRDQETAELAVQGALTGHLVLSTLHTNSASAAVPRLLDMGVETYLLASSLRAIAAQRLPRRICLNCTEVYPAPPEVMKNIEEALATIKNLDLVAYLNRAVAQQSKDKMFEGVPMKPPEVGPDGKPIIYLYRGKGCDKCGGSGYKGRIGIFEVLIYDEKIGKLTLESAPDTEIEKVAIENGMVTLIQDGYLKAMEGITTIEEVLRVSRD